MARYTLKRKNPYVKAGVLLVALFIALFISSQIKSGGMIEQLLNGLGQGGGKYHSLVEFTEEERDSVQKEVAGFWAYTRDNDGPLSLEDRVELKENGYLWQVERAQYALPSGAVRHITHVVNSYIYPSSKGVDDSTLINCVFRILAQVWIQEGDTCIIGTYVNDEGIIRDYIDVVKDMFRDGTSLTMNDRQYTAFTGDPQVDFFPAGLVDYVFKISGIDGIPQEKMYSVKNKEIVLKKSLASVAEGKSVGRPKECSRCRTLHDFIREAVGDDLQKMRRITRDRDSIVTLSKKYYVPHALKTIMRAITFQKKNTDKRITISFDLTWQGIVENVSIKMPLDVLNKRWCEAEMIREIKQWRFPPLEKEEALCTIVFVQDFE